MIKLTEVSYSINGAPIICDVSAALPTGQVIALIGPNGAGKSTLFNLMARMLPLKTGSIVFDECDIRHTDVRTMSKKVAMLAQDNVIQGRLRVRELLMFGRYPYHQGRPSADDELMVDKIVAMFELEPLCERFLSDLSGGQRQRALIAMVVCQDTPYLLLDEPLNNLDMYHAGRLMRQMRLLSQAGKTIVIVLHDINQAALFADCVMMMKSGRLVAMGKPNEVLTQATIKALYGVDVAVLMHEGRPVVVDTLGEDSI